MTALLRPYPCPHAGCGEYVEPVRGRMREKNRGVWLCGSCGGILPLRTPAQRKRRRDDEGWS